MKLIKNISILCFILITSIASSQVKFEAKVSKIKVGIIEPFEVTFIMNTDATGFTPPDFKEFFVMNEKVTIINDSLQTKKNEYEMTISYRIVARNTGEFLIEEARLILNKNSYKTKPLKVEVVNENFYDQEELEIVHSKFDKGIHVVAEASRSKLSINDSLTIEYKIYVSQDLGISKWKMLESSSYKGFEVNYIKLDDLEVRYEICENKKYRFVVFKQVFLKPKEKGEFNISAIEINIEADIPMMNNDRLEMQKVIKKIKSNDLMIYVY